MVAPYLFAAPLMQMLFQVACNQFVIIKKTWPNMLILFSGVLVNVILNFMLIPVLNIEGAAIATLLGYVVSDLICVIVLCRLKLMTVSKKFIVSFLFFISYVLCWRMLTLYFIWLNILLAVSVACIYLILYKNEIKKLLSTLFKKNAT